jgi:hypothetical protein
MDLIYENRFTVIDRHTFAKDTSESRLLMNSELSTLTVIQNRNEKVRARG